MGEVGLYTPYMNKVVLISGASSGLGKATAFLLTEKGYQVVGTSRNPDRYDFPFKMVAMDLESPDSILQATEEVTSQLGRIDCLINNAGIGVAGPLEHQTLASINKTWQTNVTGALLLTQAVVPHMRKQGGGKLINISSLAGALGLPYRSLYSASKAALDLLSDSWRMELKPFQIQSTSIWCGDMQTPIGDKRLQDINYEDMAYAESYKRVYDAIDEDVDKGLPIEMAAKQIVKITEKNTLNRRYIVAKPLQKAAVLAKAILPASTFDTIMNKFSKL